MTDITGNPVQVGKPGAAPVATAAVAKREPVSANPYTAKRSSTGGGGGNAAPRGGRDSIGHCIPIGEMNPYLSRWCIQVRITNRNDKTYSNARGDGKLFSIDMLDESGEIRGTAFNEDADRLGAILEVGKVYKIRGGRLKLANRKYTAIDNQYEITFGRETMVEEVADADDIPQQVYNFVDFTTLEAMDKTNAYCDVLAVCQDIGELTSIVTKAQKTVSKREVTLMDKSRIVVRCTLWDKPAEDWDHEVGSIIAIKAARLSDYGGVSMSASAGSFEVNPDNEGAHDLKMWYEQEGKIGDVIKVTGAVGSGRGDRRIALHQIKDENIGMSPDGKPDYFITRGTISFIPNNGNMMYMACPSDSCNKKVFEEGDRKYRCEKCNKTFDTFSYRMIPRLSVLDSTGQAWFSVFTETAEQVFGSSCQEMGELKDSNEEAFNRKVTGSFFKSFMFKCRAKAETYQDETRVKVTGVMASAIDPVAESKYLIEQIKRYA
jgi:replication factor A1